MWFYILNARWLGAGVMLTLASSFGQTFFISLFAGEIKETYGLSDGDWGLIYTVATLSSAAMLIYAGKFADEIRVGRLAAMIIAAYAAIAVGMALNDNPVVLALLIFGLRFCGQGMISHLGITATARWFRAHRARAVAIAGFGYALGEAVLPRLVAELMPVIGWRAVWGGVALVLLIAYLPLITWLARNERAPQGAAQDGQSPGLHMRQWSRREVLRHWVFWALCPGVFAPSFIGTVIFFQMVHISDDMGWPVTTMAAAYPVYACVNICAALIAGALADRFGPEKLLPIYLLPMGFGIACIGPIDGVWSWFVALAFIGASTGIANAMWGGLWPTLYGTRHLGAVKSMASSIMVIGSAIGPGVTGVLIDIGVPFAGQSQYMMAAAVATSVLHLGVVWRLSGEMPARAL